MESLIGKTISHYKIQKKLGGGGMGVVYQAEDTRLKRTVALKFLPPDLTSDEDAKKRFMHEAQAASALEHHSICTIHEIDETRDSQMFICMAYYEGETLKQKIKHGLLHIDEGINIAIQIAQGLARAHEAGMIHRDIKPANIMITDHGEVKIVDFGLAKLTGQTTVTKPGVTPGTVAYMSPEQIKGVEVDHRTDIWSFGVMLYEMLTGELPFKGDYDQAVLYSILNEEPSSLTKINSHIPIELEYLVKKCLKKEIRHRYGHSYELIDDLERLKWKLDSDKAVPKLKIKLPFSAVARKILPVALPIFFFLVLILFPPTQLMLKKLLGFKIVPADMYLAVLPCSNIGDSPENQAFCDGFTEILSSQLTRLKKFQGKLWVVPYSDIRRYNIASVDEAEKQYAVNLAITSMYQQKEDEILLALNLVDAKNLRQLQSDIIELPLADLYRLQQQVITKLTRMLEIQLNPEQHQEMKTVSTDNSSVFRVYLEARGYLQKYQSMDNIDKAINLFNNAIDIDPAFVLPYAGLGEAYWKKYQASKNTRWIDKAILNCDLALELDDQRPEILVTLGIIQKGTGQIEQAIQSFHKALDLDSLDIDAFRELAKVYEDQGKFRTAEQTYHKAIGFQPSYWGNYSILGAFYYRQGRYQEAVTQFEKVLELAPNNSLGLRNLGSMYFFLERWKEAREMYERSIEIQPTYSAYSNLGALYFYEEKYEKAAESYERALAISDKDYAVWAGLAEAYRWQENMNEKANQCYQKAVFNAEEQLKVNPMRADIMADLAGYYLTLGEKEAGKKLLIKILNSDITTVETFFRIGEIYELLGDRQEAITWIEKALQNGFSKTQIEKYPGLKELRDDPQYQIRIK